MSEQPIAPVPAPWKLKGTVYLVSFWTEAGKLPDFAYSPLEGKSAFADPTASGQHHGGISQFQIIRYTESPVGPYDELIICPGFFDYETEANGKIKVKKNVRITSIYVSQKYTCWNGRKNWNIPKHLARFEFKDLPDGATNIKVYTNDRTGDLAETSASDKPFFQATVQPMRWLPSFPFSLGWLKYVGVDVSLVQPPLPEGKGSQGELPGTDRWCKITSGQWSRRSSMCWVDMRQTGEDGVPHSADEHFWPGLGRWLLGVKMENADIDFGDGEYWSVPRKKL